MIIGNICEEYIYKENIYNEKEQFVYICVWDNYFGRDNFKIGYDG